MQIQISRVQLITILVWVVLGTGIVTIPAAIAQFTIHDAWMIPLFFLFGGGGVALVAHLFMKTFPHQSLAQAAENSLGHIFGSGLVIWILIWLYLAVTTIARELSAFATTVILPHTPEYVISAFNLFVVAYLVYLGLEVIARVNEFITPLVLISVPILFILSVRNFEFEQFLPMFADGMSPIARAAVVQLLDYSLEMLIVLQIIPTLESPQTIGKDILIASAIITGILSLIVTLTVGIVGPSTSYLNYPVLEIVRSIRIGKFIERLDTLYVMGVVSTLILKVAMFHYCLCDTWKDLFHLSSIRLLAWSGGLVVWTGSLFLFGNMADVYHFIMDTAPIYFLLTMVGIPLLLIATQKLFKK
ncbi:GerAB/ArcD/ProY family transporter [Sulfoacidibacillus thermotolerans]|uniref:Uncharacterized protein n=1 Tax=Sulfoacidibacillus thermotolerans TaxID=1765684 RepID=A0A2U3D8F7_SULT2|nr:endospore germination permease [Sulfoacidibacillus thermotolerans]PWI57555.1 hypothetical protein BM613_08010 [Sulfoacidibacillus thermotolerans]